MTVGELIKSLINIDAKNNVYVHGKDGWLDNVYNVEVDKQGDVVIE